MDYENRYKEMLNEERSFVKYVILTIVTLGFYGVFFLARVGRDLDTVATRYDFKHTMNFLVIGLPFTVAMIVFELFELFFDIDPEVVD